MLGVAYTVSHFVFTNYLGVILETLHFGNTFVAVINPFASIGRKLPYILDQGQGHGYMSKYLISGLIFHFFSCLYEKKIQTLL